MDDHRTKRNFLTTVAHVGRPTKREHGLVNPPLWRGSTVLIPTVDELRAMQARRGERVMTYGAGGSPTHWALEDAIAAIEGGSHTYVVSTGLAAATTALFAWLKTGDHLLMPDSIYGPVRRFASSILSNLGVETTYYPPSLDQAGVAALLRPNTRLVYVESPGSHTFEVQDVAAIARAAHAVGAKVLMDNTWGVHHFQPFAHGVDVSIQSGTKYLAGHSDVLIGAVTVNSDADWKILYGAARTLGQYASPDDCWLTLRGIRTMGVRLKAQMEAGLHVARWLRNRPEIAAVLHPALEGTPGHELWKRDFTGASSLFGVEFDRSYTPEATHRFIEALELFGMGQSWGGFESLVMPTTGFITRTADDAKRGGPLVRVYVGLESADDLIEDLRRGLAALHGTRSHKSAEGDVTPRVGASRPS